jgi:hypothetical protein
VTPQLMPVPAIMMELLETQAIMMVLLVNLAIMMMVHLGTLAIMMNLHMTLPIMIALVVTLAIILTELMIPPITTLHIMMTPTGFPLGLIILAPIGVIAMENLASLIMITLQDGLPTMGILMAGTMMRTVTITAMIVWETLPSELLTLHLASLPHMMA